MILKCPTCGKETLIRVNESYLLFDRFFIPQLNRLKCQSCQEEVFDSIAMDVIGEFCKESSIEKSAYSISNNSGYSLWRFIDLSKLLDIVINRRIYFTRIDRLHDEFEGSLPSFLWEFQKNVLSIAAEIVAKSKKESSERALSGFQDRRKFFYVSCWFRAKYESIAMWDLYTKSTESVAIRTTIDALDSSLIQKNLFFDDVTYLDFNDAEAVKRWVINTDFPGPRSYKVFYLKTIEYSHEKEFRILKYVDDATFKLLGYDRRKDCDPNHGIYDYLDNLKFIKEIVFHPKSQNWFVNLITELLVKHGIQRRRMRISSLAFRPNYMSGETLFKSQNNKTKTVVKKRPNK